MNLFRPKQRPAENLAFIALMAGFDALISLLGALVPFSALFIMLLVPLTATAVSLFCKGKYVFIYVLASLSLCLLVTAWDFLNTLFFLFTAVLSGTFYGLLWRERIPSSLAIFLTALFNFVLFLGAMGLSGLLLADRDMIDTLLRLIGQGKSATARTLFPLLLFGYALSATALSHLFTLLQLTRLGKQETAEGRFALFHPLLALSLFLISFICIFFHAESGYFLFGLGLYWLVYSLSDLFPQPSKWALLGILVSLFIGLLIFASAYSRFDKPYGLLLLNIPAFLMSSAAQIALLLTRNKRE